MKMSGQATHDDDEEWEEAEKWKEAGMLEALVARIL